MGSQKVATMDTLKKLESIEKKKADYRPTIFDFSDESDVQKVEKLTADGCICHVIDDFEEQLKELFQITHPTLVYDQSFGQRFREWSDEQIKKAGGRAKLGRWAYFPWNDTIVHILEDADFQRVRTARNRNLITEEEQKKFYDAVIGIGGLSVGNSVALSIVLQGGARKMRLADFDALSLSNLNRIRADVTSLGLPKVEMTARQIYALNPYAELELFSDGLTDQNITRFFDGLDIVIDELDTIPVKLRIREEAKKRGIPVLMGADNGDNAILDIDRYDILPETDYFHGRLGKVTVQELSNLDKFGIGRTITKMLGAENVTTRMQDSLLQMGKTIVSWPQLGGAALLNGIGIAYAARKIATGEPLETDRALLSLDEKLDPTHSHPDQVKHRSESSKKFASLFGL